MKRLPGRLITMSLLVVVVATVLAVACGPAATPTPTPKPTPTPTAVVTPPLAASPTATPTAAVKATATPTPGRKPSGKVVIAVELITPLVQLPEKDSQSSTSMIGGYMSIYDWFIVSPYSAPPVQPNIEAAEPRIARSWQISSDLTKITFKIQEGVQFHHGWGELTAEDVAWSFNQAFLPGSISNGAEQLAPGLKKGWDVIDKYTVVMNIEPGGFDPTWAFWLGNACEGSFGMLSKKAYDQLGPDKFNVTEIGTGPYATTAWKANDEIVAEAVENHWRVTPYVKTLHVVEMKEAATREAAFRTGEVHIARFDVPAIKSIVSDTGSKYTSIGNGRPRLVSFAGNYWGTVCKTCVNPDVYRNRPGFKPDKDHPWIGDPADPARMESARKVRWAMAMAVDREAILKSVLGGFGNVIYTYQNILPSSPTHKADWVIPYDPAKAKQFLTEAGYPNGFKVEFWVPGGGSKVVEELHEAAAEMWRKHLNLNVTVDKTVYATRRPTTVDKTIDVPFAHGIPWLPGQTSVRYICPQDGHILGLELPDDICEIGFRNDTERSLAKRIENDIAVQDYLSYWMLMSPWVQLPEYFAYRPEILEWKPFEQVRAEISAPETIVMK